MSSKKKFSLILFYSAFIGCNNSSSVVSQSDTVTHESESKTIAIIEEVTSSTNILINTRSPKGIYLVLLPSVEHIINFHADHTYILEEKKGDKIVRISGDWKPTNGIIWTYRDQLVQGRYNWQGDTLAYIDTKNETTNKMEKLTSVLENNVWRNKSKEGVEFFGVGNEPFWSIEVDEQKAISFQLSDWSRPLIFKPVSPIINSDSIVYNLSSESAAIKITVLNQFCSDGMSDYIYDNKVKVLYNKQTFTGCGILYK